MFVIPMAGLSSRFLDNGYRIPKYQLKLNDLTIFYHALSSFKIYFDTDKFIFLIRNDYACEAFVNMEIEKLGIKNVEIIVFHTNTNGQADTVYKGLKNVPSDQDFFIFNVDTFRPNFQKPSSNILGDGYLEVFEGDGHNWSFVLPGINNTVLRTTEKERISNLCSDGLYYFRKKSFFDAAYINASNNLQKINNEYYVAPLFNHLIESNLAVHYGLIDRDKVIFCGTPHEYEELLAYKNFY